MTSVDSMSCAKTEHFVSLIKSRHRWEQTFILQQHIMKDERQEEYNNDF